MEAITITDVQQAQRKWFSRENRNFFGDQEYWVRVGNKTRKFYFVRSTEAFTDMFGQRPKLHYRVNELDQQTAKIGHLTDDIFATKEELEQWLDLN